MLKRKDFARRRFVTFLPQLCSLLHDAEKCRPPRRLIILKFLFGERSRVWMSDSPVQLIMNFCRPQSIFPGNEIAGKLASSELMSNYASGLSVVVPRRWGSRWLFVFRGLLSSKVGGKASGWYRPRLEERRRDRVVFGRWVLQRREGARGGGPKRG